MRLSLTSYSAFLDTSEGKRSQSDSRIVRRFTTEEGRDYVSTHGFSEIMCLHLRGRAHRWRRNAGRRHAACTSAKGEPRQEKAQGAQNRQARARAQDQART